MSQLTHTDAHGKAQMVDISAKAPTRRVARAQAAVAMRPATLRAIERNQLQKGDALAAARIAAVLAAKRVDELIPLCHTLPLTGLTIEFAFTPQALIVTAEAATVASTGVEMEALTAAAVAALTIYDMAKGIDKHMEIQHVRLLAKSGGKGGDTYWTP